MARNLTGLYEAELNYKNKENRHRLPSMSSDEIDDDFQYEGNIPDDVMQAYCQALSCRAGGKCILDSLRRKPSIVRCQCPLGFIGERCERGKVI